MASSSTTKDHDEIRNWAEERGGKPAHVSSTGSKGDIGILRIEFPGATASKDANLEEISWDQFFEKFDERGLALLYQEETAGGERSNFNKLVSSETADEAEASGHSAASSRPGTPVKKTAPAKKGASAKKNAAAKKTASAKSAASPKKSASSKKTASAKKTVPAKKSTSAKKSSVAKHAGRFARPGKKSAAKKSARPAAVKKTAKSAHRPGMAKKSTKKAVKTSAAKRPASKKSASRKRR